MSRTSVALVGKGRFAKSLTLDKSITDGQWHEVGLVWDGTSRTLHVDGVAVAARGFGEPLQQKKFVFRAAMTDELRIYL